MTEQTPYIDEKLLMQFLLGEASSDEMKLITDWLQESDDNKKQLDELETVWIESGKLIFSPVAVDIKGAWNKMSVRVDNFEQNSQKQKGKVLSINQKILRIAYSAAAMLAIAFGIFKFVIQPDMPINQMAYTSSETIFEGVLPDGSDITLNLNSKISYPEKFDKKARRVKLEGEAFFEVEHNPKQPFIINAGDANIKVLGTSFNVNAIKGKDVEVSVTTGRVQLFKVDSISGDTASVILKAGQKGVLYKSASKPEKLDEQVEPDEMFWMNRTLMFKQSKLHKVIQLLEKYYNVDINVSNQAVLNCSYSATFTNANIDDIIEMIAVTFNFELEIENSNYLLKGNGCLDE